MVEQVDEEDEQVDEEVEQVDEESNTLCRNRHLHQKFAAWVGKKDQMRV